MELKLKLKLLHDDPEPKLDIAICSECGWKGPVSECDVENDGDWESGYYEVHLCPKCEDGRCIDEYDFSPKQRKLWDKWNERHGGMNDES